MPWGSESKAWEEMKDEQVHETYIYPEDSSRSCTLTSGEKNTFGEWAEITDSGATTLSSKITSDTHLTAIQTEDISNADAIYFLEIAYGDDKTIVFRHRFIKGSVKLAALIAFIRIRASMIPSGETVYYRMMCSATQANRTCEVSFRYHFHSSS